MRDLNHTEVCEGEECVSFERVSLTLKRVDAIKWMREHGIERADRVGHNVAMSEAWAEYNRRYDRYIGDVIAHNESATLAADARFPLRRNKQGGWS